MDFKSQIITLAEGFIPDLRNNRDLQEKFWESFAHFFSDLDEESAGKLKLLPKVLNILCFFKSFKGLAKHNPESRELILHKLSNFPISKIVGGMTGIRSLIFVAFYSMPNNWSKVNYEGPLVKG